MRDAAQRLLAVLAVILAVDDDALVVLSADVGNGARERLYGVDDLAAASDDALCGDRRQFDDDLLVLALELCRDVRADEGKEPLQKGERPFSVRLLGFYGEPDLRGFGADETALPFIQNFHVDVALLDAQGFQPRLDGVLHRLSCKDVFHALIPSCLYSCGTCPDLSLRAVLCRSSTAAYSRGSRAPSALPSS